MEIRNVTVLGAGVLGAQIAFQSAFHGFDAVAYDISDEAIEKAQKITAWMAQSMMADLGASEDEIAAAQARLRFSTDLADAVGKADLVIEAVPESPELKQKVYAQINELAPETTIFATNSSTLLPSQLADATGRPAQFLALHFANEIWKHNIAEVMGHPGTDPKIYDQVVAFARDIKMVPIEIQKENAGYVLNALLVPFLQAGSALLVNGIASPEDIDKTWKIATGAPKGPFEIYDIVGLNTAYHISARGDETAQKFAAYIKENYIDKGYLGRATGRGFYQY